MKMSGHYTAYQPTNLCIFIIRRKIHWNFISAIMKQKRTAFADGPVKIDFVLVYFSVKLSDPIC